MLRREGFSINHKRVYRLYREENLQIRRKIPKRKLKAQIHQTIKNVSSKNDYWSMDFVSDQLNDPSAL